MKLPFRLIDTDAKHEYCINCFADNVQTVQRGDGVVFYCPACGQTNPRRIVIGGGLKAWQDENGELRHESAGVFVREPGGSYLFFELRNFPYGLTIPAGHVDHNESPKEAAIRELEEEVGIKASDVQEIMTADIPGDSCSSGADIHTWHAFLYNIAALQEITVSEEGRTPQWLSIQAAKKKHLPPAIDYLLTNYSDKLI